MIQNPFTTLRMGAHQQPTTIHSTDGYDSTFIGGVVGSAAVVPRKSPNAVAASLKETRCLLRFVAAQAGTH